MPIEPPTEPLPPPVKLDTNPAYVPPIPSVAPPPPPPAPPSPAPPPAPAPSLGAFARTHFRFTTGLRSGEVAQVRGSGDEVLLTYRSFASIVGVIAAFLAGVVAVAGAAGVLLLVYQGAPMRALLVIVMTLVFAIVIAMLVPRANVTLYEESHPALTISQRKVFPSATYVVAAPNGAHLAELRKSILSRLGRNRWTITQDGRYVGEAHEEGFFAALFRKLLGKFSRTFETNIRITYGGIDAGRITRRPDASGRVDYLDLTGDALDRRVAVALATLILGREP